MSVPLLDIPLRPSRIYAGVVGGLYGLTGVLILVAPLSMSLKLASLLALLWLSWRLRRAWRRLASVQRLQVLPQAYRLITTQGEMEVTAGHQTLVTSKLVILHLNSSGWGWYLPLLPDTAAGEDLRRLRVWLRCKQ